MTNDTVKICSLDNFKCKRYLWIKPLLFYPIQLISMRLGIEVSFIPFFIYFLVFNFSVLCGHSFFSSPPQQPMTSDFEGFLSQILSITLFSYLISGERASIFPFQCWVLNEGTTGTILITSLVWRGPWLGIEPGTSRTRCQHIKLY